MMIRSLIELISVVLLFYGFYREKDLIRWEEHLKRRIKYALSEDNENE